MSAYLELTKRFEKVTEIENAVLTLREDTQLRMPPNSANDRLRQIKALFVAAGREAGAPEIGGLLDRAEQAKSALSAQEQDKLGAMRVRWMRENFEQMKKLAPVMTPYESLKERFAFIRDIDNAASIINAVALVAKVPDEVSDGYGRQVGVLSGVSYGLIAAPEVERWLGKAEASKDSLPPEDQRNLALMRKNWVHNVSVPEVLAEKLSSIGTEGRNLHTALRDTGDWSKMRDWYAHVFDVRREIGNAKKDKLGVASAYDALMDEFMPDISSKDVTRELGALEQGLPALIREALERQSRAPAPIPLAGSFPAEQQTELSMRISTAMGFDFTRGRLEMLLKGHPQSGGTQSDLRFTTYFKEHNFVQTVKATVHETGHAMYNQNTPLKHRNQLVGDALGMDVHESQSRIMEVQACHTPQFFRFLEKQAREVFNRPDDPALDAKNLERLVNRVNPAFIRVEADEMTYPVHVIVRHKIERGMIEGTITADDIPRVWNESMKAMMGVEVPDASKGHMQDVHWPVGHVGYFPAYTLGDMRAAQYFAAATKAKPEILDGLENGDFTPLREWLRDNVHSKGSLMTTRELDIAVTGEPLNAKYYLEHLSRRYLGRPYAPVTAPAPRAAASSPTR